MNHTAFKGAAQDLIQNYWRIRAAAALYRGATLEHTGSLHYDNVPMFGAVTGILNEESVEDALSSLRMYIDQWLPRDLFLALIARFEARLIASLTAAGCSTTGTLGVLQQKVQKKFSITHEIKEELDEVRERRNTLVHNDGHADNKYISAATKVNSREQTYVALPRIGDSVVPSPQYLAYAVDVLVRYSYALSSYASGQLHR